MSNALIPIELLCQYDFSKMTQAEVNATLAMLRGEASAAEQIEIAKDDLPLDSRTNAEHGE